MGGGRFRRQRKLCPTPPSAQAEQQSLHIFDPQNQITFSHIHSQCSVIIISWLGPFRNCIDTAKWHPSFYFFIFIFLKNLTFEDHQIRIKRDKEKKFLEKNASVFIVISKAHIPNCLVSKRLCTLSLHASTKNFVPPQKKKEITTSTSTLLPFFFTKIQNFKRFESNVLSTAQLRQFHFKCLARNLGFFSSSLKYQIRLMPQKINEKFKT